MRWTLGEIADLVGGVIDGPSELRIRRPVTLSTPEHDGISFAENERYLRDALATEVGALIVRHDTPSIPKPCVRVEHPRQAFLKLLHLCRKPMPLEEGVHELAYVHPEASVDATATVGPFAVVERHARVGPRAKIYPLAYVGEDCVVESYAEVLPHAVLVHSVRVGERTVVHSGAVLGAEGFGFYWDGKRHVRIPQIGGVAIAMDSEIGALTAVDRAMAGDTTIGRGTKIDNLVQVAHNVHIGEHTVIAAQVGLPGSATIGNRVTIGGQAAVSDHVNVGDDIILGARTGVTKDLQEPGIYAGYPARKYKEALAAINQATRLPEMAKKIKELEARLAALEAKS